MKTFKISLSILDWILEFFALLSILSVIVLFVFFWIEAPKIVPVHYNIYGVADRFGSKVTLIIIPIISIVSYLGLTFLNRFPYIFNFPVKVSEQNRTILYKTATTMIRWIKLFICLLFTVILLQTVGNIQNYEYKLDNNYLFILIGCLFCCLIFYIIKMTKIGSRSLPSHF